MKNSKLLIVILLFSIIATGQSQSYSGAEKFRNISISAGLRSFFSDPGTVTTSYVDDSPSMDRFMGSLDLDKYINRIGFALNYNWGRKKGLSHQLGIEGVFGLSESAHIGYGMGFTIPIEFKYSTMLIRPAFHAMIGNNRINLGYLQNNAAYIQINNTQIFDEELLIKLNTDTYILRPKVDFIIPIINFLTAYVSLGYDFGGMTNSDPELWFETVDGETFSDIPLEANKAEVTFNGSSIKTIPFDLNGPRISIGISYYWEK